jgi:hypothetical protein
MSMAPSEFRKQQYRVAAGMLAAFIVSIGTIAATLAAGRGTMPAIEPRIAQTLGADTFVILWLFASIANVARLRFFSREDIDGSGMTQATESVRIGGAIAQNTLEQTVLAIATHLAVTAAVPGSALLVKALVVLFGIGRLCFWAGYRKGAAGRAFGFGLTFYPTALTLLFTATVILVGS